MLANIKLEDDRQIDRQTDGVDCVAISHVSPVQSSLSVVWTWSHGATDNERFCVVMKSTVSVHSRSSRSDSNQSINQSIKPCSRLVS